MHLRKYVGVRTKCCAQLLALVSAAVSKILLATVAFTSSWLEGSQEPTLYTRGRKLIGCPKRTLHFDLLTCILAPVHNYIFLSSAWLATE